MRAGNRRFHVTTTDQPCPLGHKIHWIIGHDFGYCQDPDTGFVVVWRKSDPDTFGDDWFPSTDQGLWFSCEFSSLDNAVGWAREVIDLESKRITPPGEL